MEQTLTLDINGQQHTLSTDPDRPLLDVLREDLGLTGAKYGCGERQCGACTVLANGRPIFSCSTRVATVAGRKIETIEGLADGDTLHPVQQAFVDEGVAQCGYCTPGMIMTAVSLLKSDPHPTRRKDSQRDAAQRLPLRHVHANHRRRRAGRGRCVMSDARREDFRQRTSFRRRSTTTRCWSRCISVLRSSGASLCNCWGPGSW